MLREEIFFICLYVAAFGFSDYIVNSLKLKGVILLFYYTIILILGIIGVYYCKNCTF
jgi:hypothetical protein